MVFNYDIVASLWIPAIFAISGITENYISGTGHFWFITAIIICYLITPLLYEIRKNQKYQMYFLIICIIAYIPIALLTKDIIGTYYSSALEYILAFFFLDKWIKRVNGKQGLIFGIVSLLLGCAFKLVFVYLFDNTVLYTKFLTQFCSLIIGFGIFTSIYFFICNTYSIAKRFQKIISFFDSFSYEFFIVHLVLISGKFSVLIFTNPIINIVFAFALSALFGYLLHLLSNCFLRVTKWNKKH